MARLDRLQAKKATRARKRKRQYTLWEKTGKRGHLRAFRRHKKAVQKLDRLITKEKRRIEKQKARRAARLRKAWGGSKAIVVLEARPVAKRYGAPKTSAKRGATHPLTIANPGSDHSVLARTAFAEDYGTYQGENLAHAIAKALGISGYTTGNYNGHLIVRHGVTYRVQILWAVAGHFDHVHVGVRRS